MTDEWTERLQMAEAGVGRNDAALGGRVPVRPLELCAVVAEARPVPEP